MNSLSIVKNKKKRKRKTQSLRDLRDIGTHTDSTQGSLEEDMIEHEVHMQCVSVCCVYLCTFEKANRTGCWVSNSTILHFVPLRQDHSLACVLGGQPQSQGILLSLPFLLSPSAGVTGLCGHAWLLIWVLESKLRSSCFPPICRKYLRHNEPSVMTHSLSHNDSQL